MEIIFSQRVSENYIYTSVIDETYRVYSKKCLKRPLKIDKTKILMTNGCLMKVKCIAECCNTFDLRKVIIRGSSNMFWQWPHKTKHFFSRMCFNNLHMLLRIYCIGSQGQICSMLPSQWLLGNQRTQGKGPWTGYYMQLTCPNF